VDPGVGNPSLAHTVDEGQAFTGAACRENEVEVEKELAVAFFVGLHSSFMWDTCNCQTWWW